MASSKVSILKFLTHFGVGGTERQFVYLTKGLDRSRFDVRVGCLSRWGAFLKDLEPTGVRISEYRTKSLFSATTLRRQFTLAREIRRDGIQVVHAYGYYPTIFAIPAARLAGRCVTIASVRDMGVFNDRAQLRALSLKIACLMSDCVLANSYAVRDWLVKLGLGHSDIRVIPNGIIVPQRRMGLEDTPIRREFNIDRDAPLIAVVSRLNRRKGVEFFLQAAVGVVARFPSARFLIVGESNVEPAYRPELQNLAASLNLQNHVIFTGQRNDVPKMMREITISVLPSLSESFSNSLTEAMASGLPVIATNVGGNPEQVTDGESGILVPPEDAAALSRAMIQLLESPELGRTLGEAAREKVVKQFSLGSVLRQTEDLYMSLLERRGLTPRTMEFAKCVGEPT